LLTCAAVFAFSLFGEGLNATSRTEAMTILDERNHRATTVGWMAFYSPITPGDGLHFGYETELMPLIGSGPDYRWRESQGQRVDWTHDQHLSSGWIAARLPVFFRFRKSELRRERLSIRRAPAGETFAVNGLGAPILQLQWADQAGNVYTASNIAAGAQSRLTPVQARAAGQVDHLRGVFQAGSGDHGGWRGAEFESENWLTGMQSSVSDPKMSLRPNCYLATFDTSPFVEAGLRDVKTRRAMTVVYGIQGEAAGGAGEGGPQLR
jgi:hypothetical protein